MRLIDFNYVKRCQKCGHLIPYDIEDCPYCKGEVIVDQRPIAEEYHKPEEESAASPSFKMPDFSFIKKIPRKYLWIGLGSLAALGVAAVLIFAIPWGGGKMELKADENYSYHYLEKDKAKDVKSADKGDAASVSEMDEAEDDMDLMSSDEQLEDEFEDDVPEATMETAHASDAYSYASYRLTESDLSGKSRWELEVMRNTIYARHGYRFKRDDLMNHFLQYSWYQPVTGDAEAVWRSFNDTEQYNVTFIKSHEH